MESVRGNVNIRASQVGKKDEDDNVIDISYDPITGTFASSLFPPTKLNSGIPPHGFSGGGRSCLYKLPISKLNGCPPNFLYRHRRAEKTGPWH